MLTMTKLGLEDGHLVERAWERTTLPEAVRAVARGALVLIEMAYESEREQYEFVPVYSPNPDSYRSAIFMDLVRNDGRPC